MKLEELNESKVPATVMDKEMMCLAASPGAMGGNGEGDGGGGKGGGGEGGGGGMGGI